MESLIPRNGSLRSPLVLSFSLSLTIYLPSFLLLLICLVSIYLSIYLPIYLSIYLSIYHACPLEKYGGWRGCFSFGGTVQFIEESSIYLCFVVYRLKRGWVTWPNLRVIKRRISYPCSSRTRVPLFRGPAAILFQSVPAHKKPTENVQMA